MVELASKLSTPGLSIPTVEKVSLPAAEDGNSNVPAAAEEVQPSVAVSEKTQQPNNEVDKMNLLVQGDGKEAILPLYIAEEVEPFAAEVQECTSFDFSENIGTDLSTACIQNYVFPRDAAFENVQKENLLMTIREDFVELDTAESISPATELAEDNNKSDLTYSNPIKRPSRLKKSKRARKN